MPRLVVDLHLHSRYSIGCSPSLDLAALAEGARRVGLDIIAAPDFTHPAWLEEMRSQLADAADGVYSLRTEQTGTSSAASPRFLFATEVSCVWTDHSRGRRVHLLVLAPGIAAVEKLNLSLARIAALASDGRPTLNIPACQFADVAWGADDRFVIVPAHAWTPWYGVYGSKSGFDSIEECFGDLAPRIFAIETGLSSDPAMNWRVADVDGRAIVSFSDAHSPPAMGREATVLDCAADFPSVVSAIAQGRIVETLEFHPGHGKYHLDGHRKCGVKLWPRESAEAGGRCPNCGRKVTLGVLNRIEQLASRPETIASPVGKDGVVRGPEGRPPFRRLVPLRDVLSQALGTGPGSKRVGRACDALVSELGGEIAALTSASAADIERVAGARVADTVIAARRGSVEIDPGYDGEYGTVSLKVD